MSYSIDTAVTESSLFSLLRPAFGLSAVALVICGFAYSSAATGLGQLIFPEQANGSMLFEQQTVVGSRLVAQPFIGDQYFYARPSTSHYDVMAMSGSNLARSNPELEKLIEERAQIIAAREHVTIDQIPSDLLTTSGSGIDPEISPKATQLQVARVARARNLTTTQVEQVVAAQTQAATFGLLGQARVNVLALNLALDQLPKAH